MTESDSQLQYKEMDPEKTSINDTMANDDDLPTDPPVPFTDPSQDVENAEMPPVNPWMDPKSFPDGGGKAWLTVAGAAACLFVSFGWVNCVGVFQDYYQTHQLKQYSPSDISWIPSLQGGPSPVDDSQFANGVSILHVVLWTLCWQDFR